ncbi:MAG TPA: hypothetical protein EYH24_04210 [Thermococcus paralvinellae]|uniref:Uncharacterized protein n=1 Tax=Thermococcus paralvinellae TaxID=582419 RepID=A0A832ZFA5_9EURY|nr:hypothetical protein [Thermococcus paralvinellae]
MKKTTILIVILFLGSVVSGAAVYNIPMDSRQYPGAKVEYKRNFIFGPSLEIELSEKGYGIVTASILLPNGSLMELGTFSGQDRIKISYSQLTKAMKVWGSYLKSAKLDSRAVSASLLLLGTLRDENNNVQYFIKAVPINVGGVLDKRSIQVKLPRGSSKILYTKNQIEEKLKSIELQKIKGNSISATTENWPPGFDHDQCYWKCDPWTGSCYQVCLVWKLEQIIASKSNTIIPLVALQVTGDTSKINGITVTTIYRQRTTQSLELIFSAAAAVQKGGSSSSTEAEIIGTSYSINTEDLTIPESHITIWGSEISNPSVIGAGIKGTVVLAKYRLYWWDGLIYQKLNDVAYVILGKPDEEDMSLQKFVEHGWPSQHRGIGERTMWFVHSYWEPTTHESQQGGLTKLDVDFVSSTNTIPLFSASAAVLGTLDYNNIEIAPFIMAIGVGFNTDRTRFSLIHLNLQLKEEYKNQYVDGTFYSSKVKFQYKDNKYSLAGMYGDIYIHSSGSHPPCDPRTGICPTSDNLTGQ